MKAVSAIPTAQPSSCSVSCSFFKLSVFLIIPGNAKNLALPALMIQLTSAGISGSGMC